MVGASRALSTLFSGEASSPEELCVTLGAALDLDGPAPMAVTRRALADQVFAAHLANCRGNPTLLGLLFTDHRNRRYEDEPGHGDETDQKAGRGAAGPDAGHRPAAEGRSSAGNGQDPAAGDARQPAGDAGPPAQRPAPQPASPAALTADAPSSLVLAARGGRAVARWGTSGFRRVAPEVFAARFGACEACDHLVDPPARVVYRVRLRRESDPRVCAACGCVASRKAAVPTEHCPLPDPADPSRNRWGEPR